MGLFTRKKKNKKPVLGLCLSGGGARGFAHVGALKAFEQEGIDFDLVVGTSAGAIVGAMYAAGKTADEIMVFADGVNLKSVHNGFPLVPNETLGIKKLLTDFLGEKKIEDLPKKFACVAVDLVQAKQVIIDSGDVATACAASSCVPLLFKPVVRGKQHLVDGGLLNNIPADVCKMLGADKVVTVDVNPTRGSGNDDLSVLGVIKATLSIMTANGSIMGALQSDIVIAPNLSEFSGFSKDGWERMIQIAYESAREQIQNIKSILI